MKKRITIVFLLFLAISARGYCQTILKFTSVYRDTFHTLDSFIIENISTGSKIVKYYPDTTLNLTATGVPEITASQEFSMTQNWPNPYWERTSFNLSLPEDDRIFISVYNMAGIQVGRFARDLEAGNHQFLFTGSEERIYILSVRTRSYSASIRMVNAASGYKIPVTLEYTGITPVIPVLKKNFTEIEYLSGDSLLFTGYMTDGAGVVLTDTISDLPTDNKTYTFSFKKKSRIAILMYHRITSGAPADEYDRTVTDFENDLIWLRDHNYKILGMKELLKIKSGELLPDRDVVIITFDDGYESSYSRAYPILAEYSMPATFFLITEEIGKSDFMTWSQVWLLSQYTDSLGNHPFEIGSHTSSHPYLDKSREYFPVHDDYLNFLRTELGDSKEWIVDITGQETILLSLPYGDGADNQDIINIARESGYQGIRTSAWKSFTPEQTNIWSLPSIPILSNTSISIIGNYFNF